MIHRTHCIWVAAGAGTLGVIALICDSLPLPKGVIVGMHAAFAVASCLATSWLLRPAFGHPPDYLFVRWVSRWIYIFTYMLAAVRLSLFFHELPTVRPLDDFQFYVLYCLGPLWLIRATLLNPRTPTVHRPLSAGPSR